MLYLKTQGPVTDKGLGVRDTKVVKPLNDCIQALITFQYPFKGPIPLNVPHHGTTSPFHPTKFFPSPDSKDSITFMLIEGQNFTSSRKALQVTYMPLALSSASIFPKGFMSVFTSPG